MVQGLFVAAITPRRESGHEVDLGAALEVVDYLCAHRVNGIALMGSTGEFLHFDFGDRVRLAAFAIKRSRVPILVNVSHSTLDGALKLAQEAASAGAAGLLLMPPYFFPYGQAEVRQFYLRFAAELRARVPVFLYNIPFFTTEVACDTALELLSTGRFAGIKDSSGRWEYMERLLELAKQKPFTPLVGNDVLYRRGRTAGAHGVVSGVACAVPELMLGLEKAVAAGDQERIDRLDGHLREFIAWLDRFPTPVGIREACAERKVKTGPPATPLSEEKQREAAEFREWFRGWLPVVQREASG